MKAARRPRRWLRARALRISRGAGRTTASAPAVSAWTCSASARADALSWTASPVAASAVFAKRDGLKDVPFRDSGSIMVLDSGPEHLLGLGGGYIGLEIGKMFRRF